MRYVSGTVFTGEGFIDGYIGYSDGVIQEVGEGSIEAPEASGIILPPLINSHTHIGDAFIRLKEGRPLQGSLDELIKPPGGLKHRLLSEAADEDVVGGMKEALAQMLASGVGAFIDFREGGLKGLELLSRALEGQPVECDVMARPAELGYDSQETEELLKASAGIGASGMGDWEWSELEKLARHAKRNGRLFAMHASEGVREDLDRILKLRPDFLVHMTHATDEDLAKCAGRKVPIVVCPKSTLFFGGQLQVERMLAAGVEVRLGTDNAMLNAPSLWEEMKLVYDHLAKENAKKESAIPIEILRMVTLDPQKALNAHLRIDSGCRKRPAESGWKGCLGGGFFPRIGSPANFIVVERKHPDPGVSLVTRASPENVRYISLGEYIWKKS